MRKSKSSEVRSSEAISVKAARAYCLPSELLTSEILNFPLILASASPRRADLLRSAGYSFTVHPSPIDEPERPTLGISRTHWPVALAYLKALATQPHIKHDAIVLGADTIVLLDDQILGKPKSRAHAKRMLSSLSGRTHQVITGLALLRGDTHHLSRAVASCRVKRLSPAAIEHYLDSNLWQGKAGAYGIQDGGDPFVTLLSGEFSTVVGLPLKQLASEFKKLLKATS